MHCQAAGAAISLVDSCVAAAEQQASAGQPTLEVPAGFGICRPPGHHAVRHSCMGFCLFSTIAIAARYAQQAHRLKRVSNAFLHAAELLTCLWDVVFDPQVAAQ